MPLQCKSGEHSVASPPAVLSVDAVAVRRIVSECLRSGGCHLIEDLGEEERADLLMLAWLGRGLYAGWEWQEARFEARAALCSRTSACLAGLAAWLEAGLETFLDASEMARFRLN